MTEKDREARLAWLVENQPSLQVSLQEREHRLWLAGMMKKVALWVTAVMAGVLAVKAAILDFTGPSR
jgi:hypothetical protein